MNMEIKLIDNKIYMQIKSIEKIDDEFYEITFMNGQIFLLRGGFND